MTKQSETLPWIYDEYKYSGVDYSTIEEVEQYDARHQSFRNYENEVKRIIEELQLTNNSTVIDLGCGTGAF